MSDSTKSDRNAGVSRRKVLECMTWAGTGVLWTISGGVPLSLGIIDGALAAQPGKLTFLQISDSHIGFDKPANPNVIGTLEEAIAKVKSLPAKPSFMIHTGDITHLSKPAEFDNANRVISQAGLDVHYVPGEHDFLDEGMKLYHDHYGRNAKGAGWYSFDADGVHFIGLVNVVNLKAGGLGNLGEEQLKWLADDLKGKSAETPIVVFAHIPLWTVYEKWGWRTDWFCAICGIFCARSKKLRPGSVILGLPGVIIGPEPATAQAMSRRTVRRPPTSLEPPDWPTRWKPSKP